jgi:4'-phosphopantetheinyl transferase
MSLHLYSTIFPEPLPPPAFQGLLSQLPARFQQKVLAYKRWQDAYASLFGKLLLRKALRQAGLPEDLNDLRVTSFGRPYLEVGPHVPFGSGDFNISHSGNRVVCILSTQGRVGIDLEEIRDIAIDDFQSQFTEAEWAAITGAAMPLQAFYHYWTAKESLIKADGGGLQIPLTSINIDASAGPGVLVNGIPWYIQDLHIFPDYASHIACEYPIGKVTIEEIAPINIDNQ